LFLFFLHTSEEKRRSKAESELAAARRALATHEKKIQTLKHYCSMNQKERNALRTIMEVCSLLPLFFSFFSARYAPFAVNHYGGLRFASSSSSACALFSLRELLSSMKNSWKHEQNAASLDFLFARKLLLCFMYTCM
jgi:hypothetical protein